MSTDEQALEDEWEEEAEAQPPDKCPACGGSRFGIYVMGMPMTGGPRLGDSETPSRGIGVARHPLRGRGRFRSPTS